MELIKDDKVLTTKYALFMRYHLWNFWAEIEQAQKLSHDSFIAIATNHIKQIRPS